METNEASPHIRQAGSGPGVVCLHANASSSSQWRELSDSLSASYRVVVPDCYGSGKSPPMPSERMLTLSDEVVFLEPAFASAGTPFAMVAHSYGAAVALIAALAQPHRVRALALYEPTLFALVDVDHRPPNDADGIRSTAAAARAALDVGNSDLAAECFIDFWAGSGTWKSIPSARKPAIANSIMNIPQWAHALFTEPTPLAAFRELDMPILYMLGARSPDSSRAVARLLIPEMPRVRVVEFDALGHMGPVTHPELVNAEIAKFLREHVISA
jgi:pimeloyl-ACP methyl ester carboxylesterase